MASGEEGGESHLECRPERPSNHESTGCPKALSAEGLGALGSFWEGRCSHLALLTTYSWSGSHVLLDIGVVDLGGGWNAALGFPPLQTASIRERVLETEVTQPRRLPLPPVPGYTCHSGGSVPHDTFF